jgi:hypothetical protein
VISEQGFFFNPALGAELEHDRRAGTRVVMRWLATLSPDGGEGWGTDQLVAEAFFSAPAEYISVPTTRNLTPPSHPHYQCGFQRQVLPNPMTTRSLDNFIPPGKPELGDPSGDRSPCEVFILKKIKGWIPKPNR